MITPNHAMYRDAGSVLALLAKEGIGRNHRRQLIPDVLIAVSAVRAGVHVITGNPAISSVSASTHRSNGVCRRSLRKHLQ